MGSHSAGFPHTAQSVSICRLVSSKPRWQSTGGSQVAAAWPHVVRERRGMHLNRSRLQFREVLQSLCEHLKRTLTPWACKYWARNLPPKDTCSSPFLFDQKHKEKESEPQPQVCTAACRAAWKYKYIMAWGHGLVITQLQPQPTSARVTSRPCPSP